jgi:hypothetical protein
MRERTRSLWKTNLRRAPENKGEIVMFHQNLTVFDKPFVLDNY